MFRGLHRRGGGIVVPLLLLSGLLAGCGSSDLISIEMSGGFSVEHTKIVIDDDGSARCDGNASKKLDAGRLGEAHDTVDGIADLAEEGASFPGEGKDTREFVVQTDAGTVRWDEGLADLPTILQSTARFADGLKQELCPATGG